MQSWEWNSRSAAVAETCSVRALLCKYAPRPTSYIHVPYLRHQRYVRSPLGYFRRWIQGTLRVCGRLLSGVGLICMPLRSLADSFKDHHLDYTRVHCRISPERPYYLASVCLVAAACLVVYNSAKARPFSLAHTLYPHALHRDDRGPYVKIYILLTYTF